MQEMQGNSEDTNNGGTDVLMVNQYVLVRVYSIWGRRLAVHKNLSSGGRVGRAKSRLSNVD